jgi:hypothetical protein
MLTGLFVLAFESTEYIQNCIDFAMVRDVSLVLTINPKNLVLHRILCMQMIL